MKKIMIIIGNFFFKWRNYVFPLFVLALFLFRAPVALFGGAEHLELAKDAIGLLIILLGLGIRATVIGYAYIKRGGLNKKVYAETLVTEGMFTLCRNPLYLGNMISIFGIFLVHGDLLVMTIGTACYIFIYQSIIYAEEAYLEKKFGKDFSNYCQKTPRWLPVLSRFEQATKHMQFDWKRVIIKDYTTIATSLIAATAIEFYEGLAKGFSYYEQSLLGFMAICGLCVAIISFAKKKGLLKTA